MSGLRSILDGVRRQGRALALAVMAYGASVLAFGVVFAGVAVQRGDLHAGTLATVIALWAPGVIGGLAIIVAVFVVLRVFRGLWGYRAAVSSESVTV